MTSDGKTTRVRETGNHKGTQGLPVKRLPGLTNEQFYSSTNESERLRQNLGYNYAYRVLMESACQRVLMEKVCQKNGKQAL